MKPDPRCPGDTCSSSGGGTAGTEAAARAGADAQGLAREVVEAKEEVRSSRLTRWPHITGLLAPPAASSVLVGPCFPPPGLLVLGAFTGLLGMADLIMPLQAKVALRAEGAL